MSTEQYLVESLKRHLSTHYPGLFNITPLPFGAHATQRRAEMAQHDSRTAEYLGEKLDGGRVEELMRSISSRQVEMARSRAGGLAARATERARTAAVDSLATRRAEEMVAGGFFKQALLWISWPFASVVKWLWTLLVWLFSLLAWICSTAMALLSWIRWSLPGLAIVSLVGYALYYIAQGLAFQPAFPTVQRRVWYEDFDPEYELPWGVLGWVVGKVCAVLLFPLRVVWVVGKVIWAVLEGAEVCRATGRALKKAGRSLRAKGEGMWVDLQYNFLTDSLWRWYWLSAAWVSRNFGMVSVVCLAVALGMVYLSRFTILSGEPEILHFDSVQEMGAHFGIPKSLFVVRREQGSSSHYRPEDWVPLEGRDGVEVAGGRMAMDEGVPALDMEEFERKREEGWVSEGHEEEESVQNKVKTQKDELRNPEVLEQRPEGKDEQETKIAEDEAVESVLNSAESETVEMRVSETLAEGEEESEAEALEGLGEKAVTSVTSEGGTGSEIPTLYLEDDEKEREETSIVEREEIWESVQSGPETETPAPRAPKRRKGSTQGWKGEDWVGYCRKCRQRHCCEFAEADETDLLDIESEENVW